MKIVVIGGSGLIGSKLVNKLREHGHEAISASPHSGVNTLTGEGLAEVLRGTSVVVDVSNSPSFDETVAMNFFTTATLNLVRYEQAAGVRHHVALSVVGTDRLAERRPSDAERTVRGYFRAKLAQEKLIADLRSHIRSSTRLSSSNSSTKSPMLQATARLFDWRRCSSSRWRLRMSPQRLDGLRLALL